MIVIVTVMIPERGRGWDSPSSRSGGGGRSNLALFRRSNLALFRRSNLALFRRFNLTLFRRSNLALIGRSNLAPQSSEREGARNRARQ